MFAYGLSWLRLFPWALAALLAVFSAFALRQCQEMNDELVRYQALAGEVARASREAAEKTEQQQKENLAVVKENHEERLSEIRAIAVRNYQRLRDRAATDERVRLSLAPVSVEVDGRATAQCLAPAQSAGAADDAFIAACGEDALKVSAWQDWAKRNHVPQE